MRSKRRPGRTAGAGALAFAILALLAAIPPFSRGPYAAIAWARAPASPARSAPPAASSAPAASTTSPARAPVTTAAPAPAPVASAAATAAPPPGPAVVAGPLPRDPGVDVRLHGKAVFSLRAERAGQSAQERAHAASRALESVSDDAEEPLATVEEQPGSAVVFVGKTPIVTLGDPDAAAAGGGVTLHVYAAGVATRVDGALRDERKRSAIATSVLSFALLVFSGLVAFLLIGRIGDLAGRARAWIRAQPDRVAGLTLGRIEVVRPGAVRGAVSVALALAHRLAQFAVAYVWLIFALSRFDSTRGYTDRLAGFVLVPLSALLGRLGAALPLLVVAAIAAIAVGIAVRFVGLFFAGVDRGETHLAWLPRELARPTSVLVRAGVVLASIVVAAPLITGTDEGALSRVGLVALLALGLACTPVLACAAAGVPSVFGRRLKPGDFVEAGGRAGTVREVTLLEVVLEDAFGCEVRVPQLRTLWHPTRVVGPGAVATIDVSVGPNVGPAEAEEALVGAAMATCGKARVDLVSLDADGAHWRVSGVPKHGKGAASLAEAVARAIADRGIALGRPRR